jgi:hypothetical protein
MLHYQHYHPDIDAIKAEACKAAWLHDSIAEACPYPFGTPAALEFRRAFNAAKNAMPPAAPVVHTATTSAASAASGAAA